MAAPPLDRVKALLAALPAEDQAELRRYLGDILVTPDEAESIQLASLTTRKGRQTITYTYRQEHVRCGKEGCWCKSGALGHGPYTYKYWKEDGKLHKEYVGRPGRTKRPSAKGRGARARADIAASSSDQASPA